jgi:endo-1,4-beta-xylanase
MLLQDLLSKGVPVHGIGIQMHVDNTVPVKVWNASAFRKVLHRFAELGLEIHITELDARFPPPPPPHR